MDYRPGDRRHTFQINALVCIAVVAIALAVVLSSYFHYRTQAAQTEETTQGLKALADTIEKIKDIPPPKNVLPTPPIPNSEPPATLPQVTP